MGTLTLNSNVQNNFAENEQIALDPANLVPGIDPSPDRLLHGRMLSYPDAQFYRLGANFRTIPVNREPRDILSERDGSTRTDGNLEDTANYYPNSQLLSRPDLYGIVNAPFGFSMNDVSFLIPDSLEQQYEHAREIYRSHSERQRILLHQNLAMALSLITRQPVLDRMLKHLNAISPKYGEGVRREMIRQGTSSLIF